MRILFRLVVLWLVLAPIGLYFGFPILLKHLQAKTVEVTRADCVKQTATQPSMFPPSVPDIAKSYCDCIIEGVVLERDDVIDGIKKRPAAKLALKMEQQVQICSERLQKPRPEDAQVIHF